MKQLKRLTRKQKILVSSKGLHPGSYLLVMETETGLIVCDKSTAPGKGTERMMRERKRGCGMDWESIEKEIEQAHSKQHRQLGSA